jgi:hypothetical protein
MVARNCLGGLRSAFMLFILRDIRMSVPIPAPPMSDVTRILSAIEQGDPSAAEQLLPLVYDELRQLAARKLAHEQPGQTLQATALVIRQFSKYDFRFCHYARRRLARKEHLCRRLSLARSAARRKDATTKQNYPSNRYARVLVRRMRAFRGRGDGGVCQGRDGGGALRYFVASHLPQGLRVDGHSKRH